MEKLRLKVFNTCSYPMFGNKDQNDAFDNEDFDDDDEVLPNLTLLK